MPQRPRLTTAVRRQVAAREGYRCAYCRSPQRVGIPMVVDHILPLAAGAPHNWGTYASPVIGATNSRAPVPRYPTQRGAR